MKMPEFMLTEYLIDLKTNEPSGMFHPYIFDMNRLDIMSVQDDHYIVVPVTNYKPGYDIVFEPHDQKRCRYVFNGKYIDLPHDDIYAFCYALKKLLVTSMNEYLLTDVLP